VNVTAVTVVLGGALTVGAILVTMIWTIREMYAHEARFADASLFAAVANAAGTRTSRQRKASLLQAMEWYRVSNEFMFVSGRHSEIVRLVLVSEIVAGAGLLTIAFGGDATWAIVLCSSLTAAAILLFVLGLVAIYDLLGIFRNRMLRVVYRGTSRLFAGMLPFLATPWPTHWPEIDELVRGIPELNQFAKNPYDTGQLAADVIKMFRPEPRARTRGR
jgi:hypothetical protein